MPVGADNLFADTNPGLVQYNGAESFFGGVAPLSQTFGYCLVCLFGVVFTVVTMGMMWIDQRFGGGHNNSEDFNTCGRTIKTGLIAVDIVSHWTWAATLLQSSNQAYQHGVSGPFWYAAGATIQIILFGILAVQIKMKAPTAHTVLEIVHARWGTAAHLVFFFFCILTNIIVSAMLILGGAAVMNALTGMSLYAAAFLIPISVCVYTATGGLKATFLSSYIHTVIIYVALCIFAFTVYGGGSDLGSPSKVFNNLVIKAAASPVADNKGGSYLTMFSKGGFIFGIINIIGNFGTVFCDQAYWQSAIAARPSAANRGYLLGGLLWFCIPFTLATCLGLAALALDLPITVLEANEGLVPPATAFFLLGKFGGILMTIMLLMAVTSAGSAELIAVSSLFTYDAYWHYFNPKANGKTLLTVSKIMVLVFTACMGAFAVILQQLNCSLGYVYEIMGVLIGSAVAPIAMCLGWRKTNKWGAICGALGGQWMGLIAWVVFAKIQYGEVTYDTTFEDYTMLTGNVVSLVMGGLICYIWSMIAPEDYDFVSMRHIKMVDDEDLDGDLGFTKEGADSHEAMQKALDFVMKWGGLLALILIPIWPLLALPAGVFNEGYFTFWVVLSMIWGLIATIIATFLPIWESRDSLKSIFAHMCGKGTSPSKDAPSLEKPVKEVQMPSKDDSAHAYHV
ncbi:hypothetical protein WJX72_002523 [[Myrmecia] bisecta]|uniref:Urea active transporter n=1 Tax=[Myrmecia] bisecta TaxID=41462 RepID=A0AAW1PJG7_9CHLO